MCLKCYKYKNNTVFKGPGMTYQVGTFYESNLKAVGDNEKSIYNAFSTRNVWLIFKFALIERHVFVSHLRQLAEWNDQLYCIICRMRTTPSYNQTVSYSVASSGTGVGTAMSTVTHVFVVEQNIYVYVNSDFR